MLSRPFRFACTALASLAVAVSATMLAQSAPLTRGTFPELRVDANRDGRVDLTGSSDVTKAVATFQSGALFLPNIDDDARRCSESAQNCNDADDEVVNGDDDAADLAPIQTAPASWLPDASVGTLTITAPANAVRLFIKRPSGWEVVKSGATVKASELKAGLTFGLEGRDIVRDLKSWDGTVTVAMTIDTGAQVSRSTVSLHSAPMLSHHHLQAAQQIVSSPDSSYRTFTAQLDTAVKNAGLSGLQLLNAPDQWTQDWFEPMYVSMPKPDGVQGMRILMRSDQDRPAQNVLYSLRGKDVGVIRLADRPNGNTRNSFGNLETIPAYPGYPAGRIVLGFDASGYENPSASLLRTLESQQLQTPLRLDTAWLEVGHVDEFMQFLPAKNPRGFVLAVADPRGTVELLKKAVSDGNGSVRASSKGSLANYSLSDLVRDRNFLDNQEQAQAAIDRNLDVLTKELNLAESDILRVPGAYTDGSGMGYVASPTKGLSQKAAAEVGMTKEIRVQAGPTMGALYPGAINSVVTSSTTIAAAQQFGPQVGGKDLMAEAVAAAYAKVGMKVSWVDDYDTYHVLQGEVHCGSNSLRTIGRWWA